MDLFSLFLLTHENNEIKSPTKIYDFTVTNIDFMYMYPSSSHKNSSNTMENKIE